jgi:hypothetical protein
MPADMTTATVPTAAEASEVSAPGAAPLATAEPLVMPCAKVMVLPATMVNENR